MQNINQRPLQSLEHFYENAINNQKDFFHNIGKNICQMLDLWQHIYNNHDRDQKSKGCILFNRMVIWINENQTINSESTEKIDFLMQKILLNSHEIEVLFNTLTMSLAGKKSDFITTACLKKINDLLSEGSKLLVVEKNLKLELNICEKNNLIEIGTLLKQDLPPSLYITYKNTQKIGLFISFLEGYGGSTIKELDLSLIKEPIDATTLKKIIASCPNLEDLNLASCNIAALLPEIGRLTNLVKLNFWGCSELNSLPTEIGLLKKLQKLNLAWSGISSLPTEIGNLKSLNDLLFTGCSMLTILSPKIGQLKNLTNLNLSFCYGLTILPSEIGLLTKLQNLNLAWCQITTLPSEIGKLTNLATLDLSSCSALTALPSEVVKMTNLASLNLSLCSGLSCTESFINELQNTWESIADPERCAFWSTFVIGYQLILKLHDEHPLVQSAIRVQTLLDSEAQKNPKNPYILYQNLKKTVAAEKEKPLVVQLPEELVDADKICLYPEGILRDVPPKLYIRSDLPQDISFQTLNDLFASCEHRLNESPKNIQSQLRGYIENSWQTSFKKLKNNLCDNPFISSLFTLPDNPDMPIDSASFYLHRILKAILEKSNSRREQEILSEQEEMLLSFSVSIADCAIGQRDGIVRFYNSLDLRDSWNDLKGVAPDEEKNQGCAIKAIVRSAYQALLQEIFTDEKLIARLSGKSVVSQGAHQTLYLKNRFHQAVGLQHTIKFDPHTGVLEDELMKQVENNPQEVLKQIYNLILPSSLCKTVIKDLNLAFKNAPKTIDPFLTAYLENIFREEVEKIRSGDFNATYEWRARYFDMDEDVCVAVGIKASAAWAILLDMSYIKVRAKRPLTETTLPAKKKAHVGEG